METISLQCNSLSKCLIQAEISMTGRAYMGELLTQVWLKSIKKCDKEVNAQKESLKKTSWVHASSRMPTKKCVMKMKQTKQTNKQSNKKKTTQA